MSRRHTKAGRRAAFRARCRRELELPLAPARGDAWAGFVGLTQLWAEAVAQWRREFLASIARALGGGSSGGTRR